MSGSGAVSYDVKGAVAVVSLAKPELNTIDLGLLDGLPATNRKEPDRLEASNFGQVPIDRLAEIAPKATISRARLVDAGRIITAGGIASGMEMGFYLLERAGYDDDFLRDIARIMEYADAYKIYRGDRLVAHPDAA